MVARLRIKLTRCLSCWFKKCPLQIVHCRFVQ